MAKPVSNHQLQKLLAEMRAARVAVQKFSIRLARINRLAKK